MKQLVHNDGLDFKSASAGPGGIVYEQFGAIHLFDLKSGKTEAVPIRLDRRFARSPRAPRQRRQRLSNARISPTGARAVFEAHGEILTVPAEKGDIRNLTNTPGVMERDPAWSPDGKSIAYFSDESGEYALHIKPQNGEGDDEEDPAGGKSASITPPHWSPDSKHIAFNDNQLNLGTLVRRPRRQEAV